MLDKKLVESACKKYILTSVVDSKILSEKLTLEEHTKLCEKVLEMKYNEVLPLVFGSDKIPANEQQMRDYEDNIKKHLKYSAAALAGGYGLRKAVGKATKRRLTGIGSGIRHPWAKTKWGALGAGLGVATYYLYRKLSDPCRAKAALSQGTSAEKAAIKHECQIEAIRRVISQLNASLKKCDEVENKVKCKEKIQKEIIVWKKRLQNEMISLAKTKR